MSWLLSYVYPQAKTETIPTPPILANKIIQSDSNKKQEKQIFEISENILQEKIKNLRKTVPNQIKKNFPSVNPIAEQLNKKFNLDKILKTKPIYDEINGTYSIVFDEESDTVIELEDITIFRNKGKVSSVVINIGKD